MRFLKLFLLFPILFLLFSCENNNPSHYLIDTNSPAELKDFLDSKLALVSAHRGGDGIGFPENCIETFERNIYNHPTIIETDIVMTKDSVLILLHDDRFDRTSTGKGLAKDLDYDEIKSFYLRDYKGNRTGFKIPTLEEALLWGKGKVIYTLDVKRSVPYEKVIESIRKTKSEGNVIVITYNANQAAKMTKLAPDLMLSVSANSKQDIERLKERGVDLEKCVAFVGVAEPSKHVIAYMNEINVPIIMGTFGNIDARAKRNADELYYDLFQKNIQILAVNRNLEAGRQANLFNEKENRNSRYLKIIH